MKQLIIVVQMLLALTSAQALETGAIEISSDHKVFYKYQAAEQGQPTVVLMNGLIYAIENWDEYFKALADQGIGVLQIAYSTQPESLALLENEPPYYMESTFSPFYGWTQRGISTQDLIDETITATELMGLKKFSVVSLSYGSIVASQLANQYPDKVENLLLFAPAVMTSGRYNPYGASRHSWYSALKNAGNLYADYSYDAEIGNTLSMLITANKYSFDNVDFFTFYSGVYQMARSSKWFDLKDLAEAFLPDTYLFVASLEDGPLLADQMQFWKLMENNPAKKNLVVFDGSYHAIPGVAPKEAARFTRLALSKNLNEDTIVEVGTGNPPGTLSESLLDYSELAADAWKAD